MPLWDPNCFGILINNRRVVVICLSKENKVLVALVMAL